MKFALRNYAGNPVAYLLVQALAVGGQTAQAKQLGHLIIDEDCSGSMYSDHGRVKAEIEKMLTRSEFDNPDLLTSYITWASSGDVVVHWSRVPVSEIMAAGSKYLGILRNVHTRGCTCMSQGLVKAKDLVKDGELTCIWLLSDGYANDRSPNAEVKEIDKFIDDTKNLPNVFVNTVAFNPWSDFKLLSRIANSLSGVCIQANNPRQVYDSLTSTAALISGSTVPVVTNPIGSAHYQAFVSEKGRKVLGTNADLMVRGLKDGDDKTIYTYQVVTEAVYNASPAPVCGEGADLMPVYAYAKSMLAEGYMNKAKYALVATRNAGMLDRHAKALTNEEVAAFATDLDEVLFDGRNLKGSFSQNYGLDTSKASVLEICNALGANARSLSVNLKELYKGYVRRGVKKIPGSRSKDGVLTLPPVKTAYRGNPDWAHVSSLDINQNMASVNIKLTRDVNLLKFSDDTTFDPALGIVVDANGVITEARGVRLDDLSSFNAYTVVGDGALNLPSITVKVSDKKAFKALRDAGAVSGDYHPETEYTIDFTGRPLVSFTQTFGSLDGVYRKWLSAKALLSIFAATLKEQSDLYTPDQVASLKAVCISGNKYINIPTTNEYADLQTALTDGSVDTRLSYKVEIGDKDILNSGKLHSANKFLDRMFTVEVDGKPVEKVTFLDYWNPTFKPGLKVLGPKLKVTKIDNYMKPLYEDFLGLSVHGHVERILREAGADDAFVARVANALGRKSTVDEGVEAFVAAQRLLQDYMDNLITSNVSPVVFYIGSTGLLPDEYDTKAISPEKLVEKYPDVALSSDEKEALFYEVGDTILTVYCKSEYFSTGKQAQAAA